MEVSNIGHGNYLEIYNKLTYPFFKKLETDKEKNKNKIIELCHVGKFLLHFNEKYSIRNIDEEPDFILKSSNELIGLEHCIIVDQKAKEKEGFIDNIFKKAEIEIQKDNSLPNFLANCYIHPYYKYKLKDKPKIILKIIEVIKEYVLNNNLIKNDIIERIWKMEHSQKSICPNLGAWWQKDISEDLIQKAVEKKEKLIPNYLRKDISKIWLLIVIGGSGESSYIMNESLNVNFETKFDRIYILEDVANILYRL